MRTDYDGTQYLGMDLHRHRSVLVSMTADGRRLWTEKIDNSPAALRQTLAQAGQQPKVVLEATYGWYWAADILQAAGAEVHLAHPLGVAAFTCRRVKNDQRDAADLADLLRMNRLPEAWIAPEPVRQLRELARYRIKLVSLRAGCRDQTHAILAKRGMATPCSDIFGVGGRAWLQAVALPQPYVGKLDSLLRVIDATGDEIHLLEEVIADLLDAHPGYRAIQACDGIGPILAAVIVAEIGDVHRFNRPEWLAKQIRQLGVPTLPARGSALRQHVQDSPVPIVADTLGFHPATLAKLADETGITYSRYAPGDHTRSSPPRPTHRTDDS